MCREERRVQRPFVFTLQGGFTSVELLIDIDIAWCFLSDSEDLIEAWWLGLFPGCGLLLW